MYKELSNSALTRTLINNIPTAYIILNEDFEIQYINDYFLALRGYNLNQVIGEKCYVLSNENQQPCQQCAVKKSLVSNKTERVFRKDILADGTVRYLDDYAIPLGIKTDDNKRYILEMMIDRTEEMKLKEERNHRFNDTLAIMISLLDEKDEYTVKHSLNVKQLAVKLAYEVGLSYSAIWNIEAAALLHDIGKIRVQNSIINKPGKLTDVEYELIKKHPVFSYEILSGLSTFNKIKDIVLLHHERFDGKGYPNGLAGEDIPIGARIIAIADTYDAITSDRSYRKGQSHEAALAEIKRNAGTQFDSELVELFTGMDLSNRQHNIHNRKKKRITRALPLSQKPSISIAEKPKDVINIINEEQFLKAIWENTPYGYALFDREKNLKFVNQIYLDYMGYTSLEEIKEMIANVLQTGNVCTVRQQKYINKQKKIFDVSVVPINEEDTEISDYSIEIIIDRTNEIELEQTFEQDFKNLIQKLNILIQENESEEYYDRLTSKIEELKMKATEFYMHSN